LRFASVATLGPLALSLVSIGAFAFDNVLGCIATGFVGFVSFGACADEAGKGDDKGYGAAYMIWVVAAAIFSGGFFLLDIPISVTRTTILIAIITWVLTGLYLIYEKTSNVFAQKKKREEADEAAKHQAFVERIQRLVGDASQTKALLTAIERLTPYAKDEADHILGALSRDAERYVMLRALQETSTNDVLAKESGDEAEEIATAARALCADSTEMALEILRERQAEEAEDRLGRGGVRGSELTQAHNDFKKYLASLHEVSKHLDHGPGAEEGLRTEIEALGPQPDVKELPVQAEKPRRRLRSNN